MRAVRAVPVATLALVALGVFACLTKDEDSRNRPPRATAAAKPQAPATAEPESPAATVATQAITLRIEGMT